MNSPNDQEPLPEWAPYVIEALKVVPQIVDVALEVAIGQELVDHDKNLFRSAKGIAQKHDPPLRQREIDTYVRRLLGDLNGDPGAAFSSDLKLMVIQKIIDYSKVVISAKLQELAKIIDPAAVLPDSLIHVPPKSG